MPFIALSVNAKAVVEAINKRDWSGVIARCDYKVHFEDKATRQSAMNVQQFVDYLKSWVKIFPDFTLKIESNSLTDNTEVVELKIQGCQHGVFPVADGSIPATDQKATWLACLIIERNKDKIVNIRLYYDLITILDQLAMFPSNIPFADAKKVVLA